MTGVIIQVASVSLCLITEQETTVMLSSCSCSFLHYTRGQPSCQAEGLQGMASLDERHQNRVDFFTFLNVVFPSTISTRKHKQRKMTNHSSPCLLGRSDVEHFSSDVTEIIL